MKNTTFAIYEIMHTYSDDNHPISQPEILHLLKQNYNIEISRQTLIKHFELLNDFGIEISTYIPKKGYYLITRDFEKSEIFLICNAIYSSHFIAIKNSNDLIDRLLKTQSKYLKNNFNSSIYLPNLRKTDNMEFFPNIELILEAIENQKVISFNYLKYDFNKKLVLRNNKRYLIHPYHIVYMNDNFYLICKKDNYDNLSHYRIDRMKNIKIEDVPLNKLSNDFDPYEYSKKKIYMYGGTEEQFILLCDNNILDDIIERFGRDIFIKQIDDSQFEAHINSSAQGMIYFALQYSSYCTVTNPIEIKNRIKSILADAIKRYEKEA